SKPVFTHGQLYVVASRVTSRFGLRFYIDNGGLCANNLTKNMVYKEVFYNLPRAFPRFLFEFVEYENLKDRYNDDKYLTGQRNISKPLLTTTSSSHFLLDLELKENDPYRLSPLVHVVFTGMNENRPVVIHISDLFEKLMAGVELCR
ncbi:hypothetical protein Tco_0546699, partial [Tanacetum coccineum]